MFHISGILRKKKLNISCHALTHEIDLRRTPVLEAQGQLIHMHRIDTNPLMFNCSGKDASPPRPRFETLSYQPNL